MSRLRLSGQIGAVVIVAALLGLLAWKITQGESEVTSQLARGGTPAAPGFTLTRLNGEGEVSLSSLRGKTVVLNFWASYCGPCREETPLMQQGWTRWRGKEIVFVGIDVQDFRGDAREFMSRYGVTYPNVHDGKGSTVGRYGVTGLPETYFIDPKGRVRYRIVGAVRNGKELDHGIRQAQRAT